MARIPVLVGVALALAGVGRAETADREDGELLAARAAVRLEEILGQLVQIEASATGDKELADLEGQVAPMSRRLTARAADVERANRNEAVELRIAQRDIERARKRVAEWSAMLAARIHAVEHDLADADAMRAELVGTLHRLKHAPAPRSLVRRSADVLRHVRATRAELEVRLDRLLDLERRAAMQQAAVDALRERFDVAERRLVQALWHRDSAPLWRAWAEMAPMRVVVETAAATFAKDRTAMTGYLEDVPTFLPVTVGVFLLAWATALTLKRVAISLDQADPSLDEATRILDRPATVAFLAVPVVLFLPGYDNAPVMLRAAMASVAIVPLVRIVERLVPRAEAGAAYVLAVLLLVDLVAIACRDIPVAGRVLSLGSYAVALVFLLYGRRRERPVLVNVARTAAAAVIVVTMAANLGGFVQLSEYVGNGVVRSLLIGVLWFTFVAVMDAFVAIAVQTRVSAAVRSNAAQIRRWVHAVGRLVVIAVWVRAVLDMFAVREPVVHALDVVFGTELNVGEMAISLGDLLAFGVTVWLSFQLSRAVEAVLEGDVLPRMALGHGIPYAVTTLSSYAVLVVGFFFALAAAGVTVDRIALLAGALGVGAGFGLQSIVSNFVSGLVLLFERPIKIGDMVQFEDVVGAVRRIGLRASVLRTSEGAEVIVPNGALVGGRVTNWTLSDPRRRMSVHVGVAYGTDPERVKSILVGVAAQQPGILSDPAPEALFVGFGDTSLDFELRAWVARPDVVSSFRSALGIGIERALHAAGIAIPFAHGDAGVPGAEPEPARAPPPVVAGERRA